LLLDVLEMTAGKCILISASVLDLAIEWLVGSWVYEQLSYWEAAVEFSTCLQLRQWCRKNILAFQILTVTSFSQPPVSTLQGTGQAWVLCHSDSPAQVGIMNLQFLCLCGWTCVMHITCICRHFWFLELYELVTS
jgi:hypothetical protein